MIAIYKRLTEPELRRDAKSAYRQITKWFKANPKRRVCRTQLWYGKQITVKRATLLADLNKAVEAELQVRDDMKKALQ